MSRSLQPDALVERITALQEAGRLDAALEIALIGCELHPHGEAFGRIAAQLKMLFECGSVPRPLAELSAAAIRFYVLQLRTRANLPVTWRCEGPGWAMVMLARWDEHTGSYGVRECRWDTGKKDAPWECSGGRWGTSVHLDALRSEASKALRETIAAQTTARGGGS